MALVLNDRVKETTTTTGTGTLNLAGAATNFETFVAGIGDGNTVYYAIVHQSAAEFEVGLGTVTDGSPDTLSRTTILSSSNSDSAVDFSSGTKDVFCTLPASKTVFEDGSGNVTLPGTLSTASDLTIDNGSINLTYDVSAGELNHAGATFHINKSNGVDVAIGNDDLYVDMSTSRVGIGTQSPQVPLHVSHATAPNFRLSRTGTGQIYQFGIDSSGRFSISEAASEGGTKHQRFIIDDSGEVGIGVTPESNLHIKTSVDDSVAQGLVIERSANTDKGYINYQGGAFRLIATDGDPIKIGHVSNTDRVEITSGGDVTLTGNLAHASDLTLDSGGDLFLDADGGQVYFQDGGVLHGSIDMTSGLILRNHVSDADVFIQGNDGGTNINALKLDMSNNGRAIFNAGAGFSDHVNFDDNAKAVFGGGDDLQIFHDGSNSFIQDAGTGDLEIKGENNVRIKTNTGGENMAAFTANGAVSLFHDNSEKFATTSTGVTITDNLTLGSDSVSSSINILGDVFTLDVDSNGNTGGTPNMRFAISGSEKVRIDSSGNFLVGTTSSSLSSSSSGTGINLNPNGASAFVRDGGTTLYINRLSSDGDITQFRKDGTSIGSIGVSSSDLVLTSSVSDKDILFKGNDGGSTITALTLDMSASGAATFNDQITLGGNLVHAGNFTIDSGGDITLDADGADIKLSDGGTEFGRFTKNGNDFELRSTVTNGDFKIIGERTSGTVTAMTIDMSDGGAVSFNSKITSNNIRLENGILAQSSGDLSIDVAGDITLDADGGDLIFKDGGTSIAKFSNSSSDLQISVETADKDIKFNGTDGSSGITALLLDMSEAGTATFNNGVIVQGDLTVQGTTTTLNTATLDVEDKNITVNFGSGDTSGSANGAGITIQDAVSASNDATILWDATNDEFDFSHTVNVTGSVVAQTKLAVGATAVHGSFDFYNQNTAYFNGAVTINDNLSITAGSISITGDGSNATTLTESGSGDFTIDTVGTILLDSGDGTFKFRDDGSDKGRITVTSDIISIVNATQDGDIKFDGLDGSSSITALRLDMSDAGTATFNHDIILGDNGRVKFGNAGDMSIFHNATDTFIQNATGSLIIENTLDDSDLVLKSDDGSGGTTAYITLDGSAVLTQFDKDTKHTDSVKATFGNSADLEIYHDGTHSYVDNDTGSLYIRSPNSIQLENSDGSEDLATFTVDGAVVLYHDGSSRFATDAEGANVTGTLDVSSKVVVAGGTEATSSDGSIRTEGGLSVAKKIFGGSDLTLENASSPTISLKDTTQNAELKLFAQNSNVGIGTFSNHPVKFYSNSTEVLEFDTSQNSTFAGTVTATALNISQGTPLITLTDTSSSATTTITLDGVNTTIDSNGTDGDIIFKGNDGGSEITALTLDMSAGGKALFKNDIERVSGDLTVSSANGSVVIDANTSSGDILLDADGGTIVFLDAGTIIGEIALDNSGFIDFSSSVSDSDIRLRGNDGGSTITALTLDMSEAGAATFNNNVTAFSDERLKDNIETLEDGLDKVEQLRGVTYTRDEKENIGVIAQEVERILPEIVLTADDEMGTKSVDYSRITAVLIEAVKELSARVKELESK